MALKSAFSRNKYKTLAASLLLATIGSHSHAQLAGKNVILVHGFMPDNLFNPPANSQQIEQNGEDYWSTFWGDKAEARLDWDSTERIEWGTSNRLFYDAKRLAESGLCNDGCVMVTHSTGDLVVRYFLENQADWLADLGLPALNILAVLDFAGAGGGTEIADTAISVATSPDVLSWAAVQAVEAWIGAELDHSQLGVLYDLQPSYARTLAMSDSEVPRLRFVGGGSDYLEATAAFVRGYDDGVVPPHSSCGSVKMRAYESCSPDVDMDGEVDKGEFYGPTEFFHNYYPVLMGDDTHHAGTINNQKDVKLTYVNNLFLAGGMLVDFVTTKEDGWFSDYQYVKDSERYSMSENVYNTLNAE